MALVTGRELDVARSMAGLEGAAYAASHGLDFWIDGLIEMRVAVGEYPALVDRVVREVGDLAELGITIERKGSGVAFHYRRAAHEAAARAGIERAIESTGVARHFQRIEGRKVIELRPDVEASKGTAARRLAHRLGVRSVICLGDDRTDVDMFQSVAALAGEGIETRSAAVMSPEIHPDVLAAADYSVDGVGGVEWLLAELADAVRSTAG